MKHLKEIHNKTENKCPQFNLVHNSEYEEEEDLKCELCGHVAEDFDKYIDHKAPGDCVSYCNPKLLEHYNY